ncbi:hypothetical protein JW926_06390 [Candidatus Sumerlaeota bacterium]|nr:hypothetical protein [Candidatus Sumerlaeota bacterium]
MAKEFQHTIEEEKFPSFCWDRNWTVSEIRRRLRDSKQWDRDLLMAWIMRESPISEVWDYLTPVEVADSFPRIQRFLGRRRDFWNYIIGAWREPGKI